LEDKLYGDQSRPAPKSPGVVVIPEGASDGPQEAHLLRAHGISQALDLIQFSPPTPREGVLPAGTLSAEGVGKDPITLDTNQGKLKRFLTTAVSSLCGVSSAAHDPLRLLAIVNIPWDAPSASFRGGMGAVIERAVAFLQFCLTQSSLGAGEVNPWFIVASRVVTELRHRAADDEATANSAGIDAKMSQLEASMRSAVEQSVAMTRDVLLQEIREQQGTMADMLTAQQHQVVYPSAARPPAAAAAAPPDGATTVRDRDERTKDFDDREPKRIRVDHEDEDRESNNPFQSKSGAPLPSVSATARYSAGCLRPADEWITNRLCFGRTFSYGDVYARHLKSQGGRPQAENITFRTDDGQITAVTNATPSAKIIPSHTAFLTVHTAIGRSIAQLSEEAGHQWFFEYTPALTSVFEHHSVELVVRVADFHLLCFLEVLRSGGSRPEFKLDPAVVTQQLAMFVSQARQAPTSNPKPSNPVSKPKGPKEYTGDRDAVKDVQCKNAQKSRPCAFKNCPFSHKDFPAVKP